MRMLVWTLGGSPVWGLPGRLVEFGDCFGNEFLLHGVDGSTALAVSVVPPVD